MISAVRPRLRVRVRAFDARVILCLIPLILGAGAAYRWGLGVRTFLLIGALGILGLLSLPSWVWAAGAVGSALLARVITGYSPLPGIFVFADFGIVYVGLASVLIRNWGVRSDAARHRLGRSLSLLFIVLVVSWILHPSDLGRPLVVFMFWAEPFALILMLVIEPPSPKQRRFLIGCGAALAIVQVPFAAYQAATLGFADPVVGTLLGQGGGAHVMSGVTTLFGLALMSWGLGKSLSRALLAMVLALPFVVIIPLVADAKQVVFVLPIAAAVLFFTTPGFARKAAILLPAIVALYYLLVYVPAGHTAVRFLEDASSGKSGKLVSAEIVLDEMRRDPSAFVFGLGPANGVSRAAFMTGANLREGSPLASLGLTPAALPLRVAASAAQVAGGTSFNLPLSSALGVFSDIGVIGTLAYGWVIVCTCLPLMRKPSWAGRAALAGWAMSIPLAVTFDWWEQPPFMLALALLTAIAWNDRISRREVEDVLEESWALEPVHADASRARGTSSSVLDREPDNGVGS